MIIDGDRVIWSYHGAKDKSNRNGRIYSHPSLQERLLEEFDYVEDLGYISDNVISLSKVSAVNVVMNIRDKIATDGTIDDDSMVYKEYGINHQYETYELVVDNNPTYIIGVRRLSEDSDEYYTTLYANYSRINASTFCKILEERDNLKRSFRI